MPESGLSSVDSSNLVRTWSSHFVHLLAFLFIAQYTQPSDINNNNK